MSNKNDKVVNIIRLVTVIIPVITAIIQIIESWTKGTPVSGPDKKEQALYFIKTIWEQLQDENFKYGLEELRGIPFEDVAPMIGVLIDSAVYVAKRTNIFVP